jgi:hypothetical protein
MYYFCENNSLLISNPNRILMKKMFFLLIAMFVIAIVATMVARPSLSKSSSIFISNDEGTPLADSVMKIVKVSCMDCHNDGGGMAASHVNFSKWAGLTKDKQASKANDVNKLVTKGSMPPGRFLIKHPEAALTMAQKNIISNWAKALNK